jgi:hypothetical protein
MECSGYFERYCGVVLNASDRLAFEGKLDSLALKLQTDTIPALELSSSDNGVVVSTVLNPAPTSFRVSVDSKCVEVGASIPEPTSSAFEQITRAPYISPVRAKNNN